MTAAAEFLRRKGADDIRVAFAPGRINLIGEHTDYNGGFVLPAAINLGVVTAIAPRAERSLVMTSLQQPEESVEVNLDALVPGALSGWSAYVAGAVWALSEVVELSRGLEIVIDGDLPMGAGLSSSAAVECSVLLATSAMVGGDLPRRELARLAQLAENVFVGVPTGSMDQVASMMGEPGCAIFFDVRDEIITPIPLLTAERDLAWIVIDTRAEHALVDGGYANRRASCEESASILGVSSLREIIDADQAIGLLRAERDSEALVRRTRHVVTENARVLEAVKALHAGNFSAMGALMTQSHDSLRDDFEVSCLELDLAVAASMRAGALGARMMGGGFGGSAIALIEKAHIGELSEHVAESYRDHGLEPARVIEVEPGPGARLLSIN